MAAQWRRCQKCRKVLSAEDFEGESVICRIDAAAPEPTTKSPGAKSPGAKSPATKSPGAVTTRVAPARGPLPAQSMTAIRGRGDAEVRARRARVRALERLAERYAEDFEFYLREERASEDL